MIHETFSTDLKLNIGVSLVLVGVPLGMYFNHMFPSIQWSPLFMAFSVFCCTSFSNLFKGRFSSWSIIFGVLILYQLVSVYYLLISDFVSDKNYIYFHLYIILLSLGLATQDKYFRHKNLIFCIFLFSLLCSFLGLYFISSGVVIGEEAWELRQMNQNLTLESFTISNGSLINFICSLFLLYSTRSKNFAFFVLICIILDSYILLVLQKRTPIFVAVSTLIIYFIKIKHTSTLFKKRYIFVIFCAVFLTSYFAIEEFRTLFDRFVFNTLSGILNIFGNTSVYDIGGSAIMRYHSRIWAYEYILNNFDNFNYFFGAGYMTGWLDNPILQSYLDMGVIGLFFYVFLVICYPIYYLFINRNHLLVTFFALICMYNILSSINSGNPYLYIKYTPLCLLVFVNQNRGGKYSNFVS